MWWLTVIQDRGDLADFASHSVGVAINVGIVAVLGGIWASQTFRGRVSVAARVGIPAAAVVLLVGAVLLWLPGESTTRLAEVDVYTAPSDPYDPAFEQFEIPERLEQWRQDEIARREAVAING